MTGSEREYAVHVRGISAVEYREPGRTVRFAANMRDHEVHLGHETVIGPPLTPDDRERIIQRTYEHLNDTRHMQLDFLHPDGSYWGQPQEWRAEPLSEQERARIRAQAERGRRISRFFRSLFGS